MMFNFLKKNDSPQENTASDSVSAPVVFEEGKERQFKDPKTGEYVYQRPLSEEHRRLIKSAFQKNMGLGNLFMQLSIQRQNLEERIKQEFKNITESEKEVAAIMSKVRSEMKLDSRWGVNPQLMVLEKREPPDG